MGVGKAGVDLSLPFTENNPEFMFYTYNLYYSERGWKSPFSGFEIIIYGIQPFLEMALFVQVIQFGITWIWLFNRNDVKIGTMDLIESPVSDGAPGWLSH